jgi:peptide/nickel transport system substrate-binding protein
VAWLAIALSDHASAQGKVVVAENFGPRAGFALETDDAHVLTRAGCMEALARVDFDGALKPALATSWGQTSPTTWEFKLREGVKFQDGKAMTADIVAAALTATLSAKTPSRGFSPRVVKSVEAARPGVIRVTTPSPSVLVPFIMASPNTGILSPGAMKDGRIDPVAACTGPFAIVTVNGQQSLTLKRNDSWWGGKVTLAEAEVRFLPDANVRATQVRSGEAHIGRTVPASTLAQLKRGPGTSVVSIDTPRTSQLLINTKKAPLDNPRVRQALQAALDLKGIAASVYEGSVQPAIGPFAPHEPWAPKGVQSVTFDAARAKTLLAEAGIQPGSLKLQLLAYSEKGEFRDLSAIIQEQLKAIGVSVDVRIAAYAAIEPDMTAGTYDIALLSRSHLTDVADPLAFLTSDYTCNGGYNLSHYCNAAFDEALSKAGGEADPVKRQQIYAAAAKTLQDQAVNVFLIHERGNDAILSKVKGYVLHPLYHYTLTPTLAIQ